MVRAIAEPFLYVLKLFRGDDVLLLQARLLPILSLSAPINRVVTVAVTALNAVINEIKEIFPEA